MIEGIDIRLKMRSDLEAAGFDADKYLAITKSLEHIYLPERLIVPNYDTLINEFYCPRDDIWDVLATLEWKDIKAKSCKKEIRIHLNAWTARTYKCADITHLSIAETFNLQTGDHIEIGLCTIMSSQLVSEPRYHIVLEEEEVMKCPKCGKEMQVRKGRFGRFYGCSDYPKCDRTVDLKDAELEGEEKPQCISDESYPCWDCKFRSTEHCPLLA